MPKFILLIIMFLGFSALAKISTIPVANLNKSGVILDGYDAVSYFKSAEPVKGNSNFQTKYAEAIYWFANDANKEIFLKDPKKYEPQFGGWCAFAVADSKSKVEIDPKSFVIQDGRLLVFYNGFLSDTRNKWLHTKDKDPKSFLKQADDNWPQVKLENP